MAHRLGYADRMAAGFLLVLLAAGSLILWIGIPLGWLWLASKVTHSSGSHFFAAMVGTPVAIILFGSLLAWINRLYLRIVWSAPLEPAEDDEDEPHIVRGPLEPLLVGSLAIAIAVLCVWFFVFASNPGFGPW
ncbi:MAG TPA: hypothetical protein VEK39_14500 [Solirubrobacterales bacterium]|nr:hypothetical protein [Solirubrobacterales bacterium]